MSELHATSIDEQICELKTGGNEMNGKKFGLAMLLVFAMLNSSFLTGCGSSGNENQSKGDVTQVSGELENVDTLYVGSYGANWDKGLQAIAEKFEA